MNRNRKLLTAGVSVALAAVGVGATSALASGAHPRAAHAASVKPMLKLATVNIQSGGTTVKKSALVNGSGRAAYLLTGDTMKHPECTSSACHSVWAPITSSAKRPAVGKGVTGKIMIWHHGSINQVVINGHPAYTYSGDSGADHADGEGIKSFGGTWKVLSGAGNAVSVSSGSSSGGGSGGGGGGTYTYSY